MEMTQTSSKMRIHPLAAGAAVAVIIASAVGVAAMTGNLPGSNATPATQEQLAAAGIAPAPVVAPAAPAPYVPPVAAAPVSPPAPQYAPPPPVAQAAASCATCGVVASVSTYQSHPQRSVPGMIGGGVLGAVVGSQIGHGSTNTLATVGGAAGGAYLGNEIGKKVQTVTRYRVTVHMDAGGTKTFTYGAEPGFSSGQHVRVDNGKLVSAG